MPFNSGSGGFWCISFVFDYNFLGLLFYALFQVILNGVNKAVVDVLYELQIFVCVYSFLLFYILYSMLSDLFVPPVCTCETFPMSVCNSRIDQAKLRLQELYPHSSAKCRLDMYDVG